MECIGSAERRAGGGLSLDPELRITACPEREQILDHFSASSLRRGDDRSHTGRLSRRILLVNLCPSLDQQFADVEVATGRSGRQWTEVIGRRT